MAKDLSKQLVDVVVTAKCEKFRRAGKLWTRDSTAAQVTPEELAILQSEPMLVVVITPSQAQGAKNETP